MYPFQHITRNDRTQNATSHSLPKYRKISRVREGAAFGVGHTAGETEEARFGRQRR